MARYGEGDANHMSHHDPTGRVDSFGGTAKQLTAKLHDLPGWSFGLSGGRVNFISNSLASWLGYETAVMLQGSGVTSLLAGPLPVPRDQGRVLLALRKRDGSLVHVEMASVEVKLGDEAGLLLWSPGQGAELPDRPRRAGHMSSLVAGLAHELNNPLTYLSLNLGFVERELATLASFDEGPDRERLRRSIEQASEALRVAREGAERLSSIVRDLRSFSRAGDGVGPVDPRRTLEMALALTRNTLRHKARLQLDLGDVSDVEANEAQLGQSFLSLLLAVVQGIPDGNVSAHTLDLRLSQPTETQVELRFCMTGPWARLDLSIEPELDRCRSQLAALGGCLLVEGATVVVRLPAAGAPRLPVTLSSLPPVSDSMARPRVLLIEDEPAVADALRLLIGDEAEIEHAQSGRQAIEVLLRDQRFHLILCDLMMPDMGGIDVHEAIRRARPGVEDRIVFLTGGAFTQRTRDFLRSMPNRTLDKPVDPALLLSLVRSTRRFS